MAPPFISPIAAAWADRAEALAVWSISRLVNRDDACGGYYRKDGSISPTTRKASDQGWSSIPNLLRRHFRASSPRDVIGLHSTVRDDNGECWSRWIGIDIDRHGDDGDQDANFRAALAIRDEATALGFRVLLIDSNGCGGYHILICFTVQIESRAAFSFARWLIRDWESLGLDKEPETFPKQPTIAEGKYGNWLRVFGRHPRRDHWSRVHDADSASWLDGADAIALILATDGDDPSAIPIHAIPERESAAIGATPVYAIPERPRREGASRRDSLIDGEILPGDDFAARVQWADILRGWALDSESEGVQYLRRPGKDRGTSATLGGGGFDLLYVFTNATEFTQHRSYNKFGAYATLNHGGDFGAARRALAAAGYGATATWDWSDDGWIPSIHRNPIIWSATRRPRHSDEGMPDPLATETDDETANRLAARDLAHGANGDGPPVVIRAGVPEAPDARTPVEINTLRHTVLKETLLVLPRDEGLFVRGNALARIAEPRRDDTVMLHGGVELRNTRGTVRVVLLQDAGLSCRLTSVADFFTWKFPAKGEPYAVSVHPPPWLVASLVQHEQYDGVSRLEGVVGVPFPRPDGSLVTTPGYDDVTGYYYSPSIELPPIPERPTHLDAVAAAAFVLDVVKQFPFLNENDKAVWLAYVLTLIARPCIPLACPGFAFIGNRAGTGKGKLIDIGAIIAAGHGVPTTSYPYDNVEAEKVKVAFALEGALVAHFDNLDSGTSYGGGVIDSALTTNECGGRILGLSKNAKDLVLRTIWTLSGNNVTPIKDADRRWLVVNLHTDLERPEERDDIEHTNLIGYIQAHRAELVHACLIILRAHAIAGRPSGGWAPLGSFETWDPIVRGAVWFATGLDCNLTRKQASEEAPERANKAALLDAWYNMENGKHGEKGISPGEAARKAVGVKGDAPENEALGDILAGFSRDGRISANKLGFILKGLRGQTIAGMRFHVVPTPGNVKFWVVEKVSGPSARPQTVSSLNYPDSLEESPGGLEECKSSEESSLNLSAEIRSNSDVIMQQENSCRGWRTPQDSYTLQDGPEDPAGRPPEDCGGCLRLDCPACNPPNHA